MCKKIKITLFVSLFLNVLLLGVGGGVAYKYHMKHKPPHKHWSELDPATRNVIGRTLQASFKDMKELGNEARKSRAELVKILSAEEFDEAAFDAQVEKILAVKSQMMERKVLATKDIARALPMEERAKVAERMTKMLGGGHERRVKRHRRPDMIRPDHKPEEIRGRP